MKLYSILLLLIISFRSLLAQLPEETGISAAVLRELRNSLEFTTADSALINAITNNELNKLALNRSSLIKHNNLFTNRIETKGITDQKNSGRCWIFAGLNVLRPMVIKKYKLKEFEFSQSFISFYDKLEKANFLLEFVIQTRDRDIRDRELDEFIDDGVQDGGYWHWFVALVEKYGLVPKEVFPETNPSSNTWLMTRLLNEQVLAGASILRKMAQSGSSITELRTFKTHILKNVYRILVMSFTEPPGEFVWRYEDKNGKIIESKKYTPQEFYREAIGANLRDYVSLINYPGREYNRLYQFDNCRNIYDAEDTKSANVKMSVIKEVVQKSILNDEPVWFACDVGKDVVREQGILNSEIFDYNAIFRTGPKMDKETRIQYRFSTSNHAMVLLGVDILNDRTVKWLVENSHGRDEGDNGYYSMYDNWFDDYVYEVIVNKKYLTEETKKIFEQEPIHLPVWDPMSELLRVE